MKKAISIVLTLVMLISTFSCLGIVVSAAGEVESISYTLANPIEFIEGCGEVDYWYGRYEDEEAQEWCHYKYSGNDGDILTVNYTDGSSIDYVYDFYNFVDSEGNEIVTYDLWDSNQSYENQWTAGNSYEFVISYMDKECVVPVTIVENPIESIYFEPSLPSVVSVSTEVALSSWFWSEASERVVPKGSTLVIEYKTGEKLNVEALYSTGSWSSGNGDGFGMYFGNDDTSMEIECWAPPQYGEPINFGEEFDLTFRYMGKQTKHTVSFINHEEFLSSIEFAPAKPYEFIENSGGYFEDWYNTTTKQWETKYFYDEYSVNNSGDELTINYTDGSSVVYTYDDWECGWVDSDGNSLYGYLHCYDYQSETPWTIDGDNYIVVKYMNQETQVPVTIVENPVASISYTPAGTMNWIENDKRHGEIDYYYYSDPETCDDYEIDWFRYTYNRTEGDVLTVNNTDGSVIEYVYDGWSYVSDDGSELSSNQVRFSDNQNYHNQWTVGNTYDFTVSYLGFNTTVSVNIIENPVASISFTPAKPIEIISYNDCWYYTQDLFQKIGNKLTVGYKDGTFEDFVYDGEGFVSENGEYLRNEDFDYEYQQRWDDVGSFSFELGYLGAKTEIPVEIVSGVIAGVSFVPKNPLTYIQDYGMSQGIYEIGNVITLEYADGRSVAYEYRIYENDDLPYYQQGLDWYDEYNNALPSQFSISYDYDYDELVEGNTYTGNLEVYDYEAYISVATDFEFTVIENPIESISVDLAEEIKLIHNIDSTHGMETGDSNIDYYYFDGYRIPDGTAVTVNYKDGTSDVFYKKLVIDPDMIERYVMFLNENNERLDYELYTNQSQNPWEIGTNYAELSVYGVTTEFPVTVLPGPESMVITPPSPVQVSEHTCGYWTTDMDDGSYYQYEADRICGEGWKVVLNYEDGSVKEYITSEVDMGILFANNSDGDYIQLYMSTNHQPWEIGGESYVNIEYGALTAEVPVTIVDSPEHELTVIEVVEATCTKSGYTTYYCGGCAHTFDSDFVPRKGHNIVDGVCENCGSSAEEAGLITLDTRYEFEPGSDIVFVAPETGYYKFASYGNSDPYIELYKGEECYYSDDSNGLDFDLQIYMVAGETVEGAVYSYGDDTIVFDVTYMGDDEFGGEGGGNEGPQIGDIIGEGDFEAEIISQNTCMLLGFSTDATEVTVPSQIRGYDVVCIDQYISDRNVEVLNLPATITELSQATFSWWDALKEINISEDNTVYKYQNGIVYDYSLEEIIVIPIAFCGEIVIPLGTTELDNNMLAALKNASNVSVAEGHTAFAEEDGIIYNSDFTKIYFAKTLPENYVMKESVKELVPYAFAGNDEVRNVTISSNVTSIAYAAFNGCSALETVELPEGLVSIEEAAFGHNIALQKVDLPSKTENVDNLAFYNCTELKEVNFNEGLIQLGSEVFSCTAIEKAILPDSLSQMGGSVFSGCSALSQVEIGSGLYDISGGSFSGCTSLKKIDIPSNIKEIYSSAFANSGLISVDIPDTVEYMASFAFGDCENLVSANIGKGVGIIERSFQSCDNLETVTFADGFNGVCKYAFLNCPKLENVDIPNTVTEISYYQFKGCTSLDDFDIPSTLLKIDGHALDNTGWYNSQENGDLYFKHILYGYKDTANDNATPAKYTVDVNVGTKSIAYYAFQDQDGVTEVKLPYTMEYVGDYAFYNCANLTSIKIPANVTYIGEMAIGYSLQEVYNGYWDYYYYEEVANPNFIVYGVPGSVAETYANENGLRFEATCAHSSTDWIVDEPATCKAVGSQHKECTACQEVLETEAIAKLEHTASDWIVDEPATCKAVGFQHKECTACQEVLETATIAKLEHTASDWIVDEPATCKAAGSQHKECTACQEVLETEAIAKLEHTASDWIVDEPATCKAVGSQHKECTACGETLVTEEIAKLEHVASDWIVDEPATCKAAGSQHKECTACQEVLETEAIAKLDHVATDWVIDKNPTCFSEGSHFKYCKECGITLETEKIAKIKHTASSWKTDKKATVTSAGSKHKECTKCGKVLETAKIAQLKCSKPKLSKIENTADGVKITWSKVSGADRYRVYRKTSKGDWKYLGYTSKTGYTDKTAKSGTKYYYAIKARNEAGDSSLSSSLSKYYLADPTLKTPKSTKSGVALEWNKISGSDGYMVYRKTGSGSYKEIATVKGYKKVKYTDKSAKKGKTYTYKVKAYKSKTYSAYSNTKKIKDKY